MTTSPPKRDRSKRGTWWTLTRRRWAYGIAAAAAGVAIAYGIVTPAQTVAWLALAGALLGVSGLALANPTK